MEVGARRPFSKLFPRIAKQNAQPHIGGMLLMGKYAILTFIIYFHTLP